MSPCDGCAARVLICAWRAVTQTRQQVRLSSATSGDCKRVCHGQAAAAWLPSSCSLVPTPTARRANFGEHAERYLQMPRATTRRILDTTRSPLGPYAIYTYLHGHLHKRGTELFRYRRRVPGELNTTCVPSAARFLTNVSSAYHVLRSAERCNLIWNSTQQLCRTCRAHTPTSALLCTAVYALYTRSTGLH